MTKVNRTPFTEVPKSWAFDPEIGPFIRNLLDMLFQLRLRSGGDEDGIEISGTRELFPWRIPASENNPPMFDSGKDTNIMDWL